MDNFAVLLYEPNDLRIEKIPVPAIDNNEVLIKIECVGICGSDLKMYSTGRCGLEVVTKATVMGHEGAGTVLQVGKNVKNVRIGDRVAIEPTQPCRACEFCRGGRYNVCVQPRYCSVDGAAGNLSTYYKHVADFCHKIPDNVSMEEGAAVQPLAIAIHACNRAGIRLGSTVAIMGAGPIGVLCAMTARAMGATTILITDVVESRLKTAGELGVDHTLLLKKEDTDKQIVDNILNILGVNPNITIDACGFASAQRVAMMVTRTGGTVLVVGIGGETVEVPLTGALLREVNIIGAYRLLNSYPAAISAVSTGAVDLKSFITHHFPLEKAKDAFELAKSGEAMKIIIHVDSENK
ncbi:sorbitol dehydrogenase-like [Leptidea sinapis]|uniref:sorbitol dehydrogenase-like n=1 Tax=Leptidea sinapis TaxID=189913 RepID=UPI0021C478FB|nr:sorbitol dehydrogenase-like [Leptidea sinapis]